MRIPIRARNGASNAIRIKNRDMISSTIEKTGFAALKGNSRKKAYSGDCGCLYAYRGAAPAMIANAH